MDKIWGSNKKKDPLAERIKNELLRRNFLDILPTRMLLTWENGRIEKAYIAKRLDRFLLHASLIDSMGMPFSSIENFFISDHRPTLLGWKEKSFRKGYSFKFNRSYLDLGFNNLIKKTWNELASNNPSSLLMTFKDKMVQMCKVVKQWKYEKRQSNRKELRNIQRVLDMALEAMAAHQLSFKTRCLIKELQKKKIKILEQEESFWRLKIRATWFKEGDKNTKFFHNFANARREKNSIWKIRDGRGCFLYSQ